MITLWAGLWMLILHGPGYVHIEWDIQTRSQCEWLKKNIERETGGRAKCWPQRIPYEQ